jgi:glycosyltransferase involved in cell wall biosynthesis
MNIAIDIRCLLENNYSGVPQYTYHLLKNLFKIDSKNQYYLFYNKYNSKDIFSNIKEINELTEFKNVKIVGFDYPNKFFNLALRLFNYPKIDKLIERQTGDKIDLFFLPNPNFISLSAECKLIMTMHDLSFERYPEFFAGKDNFGIDYLRGRFWHKYVGVKNICQKADKIIAVSESTKNDLVDIYGIEEKKIQVVYEAPSVRIMNYELRIKNKEEYILFLGTLEPRKNIESIIKAFELLTTNYKLPTINLKIAGKKGWLYEHLFELVENSKVKDRIKFIGYVAEEDKAELYTNAKLFIFPAYYEGFGLPPLEAMSYGCPVVVSNSSSLPEVVGDAGILVNPYNISEIAQAMKEILSDEELRNDLIAKGLKRAEMFSWEKTARETLEIFEK